jgi:CelD/BcsL family acetyltransferase involved in cellulose biosynthesis
MSTIQEVTEVYDEEGFERLGDEWNILLQQSSSNSIFLTWEWITAWWKSYGVGKALWILKICKDGELVGLVPFYREHLWRLGTVGYRGVRFIGDGSADSDYLDIISKRGEEHFVVNSIVRHLVAHREQWDVLFFSEVPETSAHLPWLRKSLKEKGYYWDETKNPCSQVALPSNWNEYVSSLKPRMRTKLRSLTSRLEKEFNLRFECCDVAGELEQKLESLFDLHNQRWRRDGREGVFVSMAKQRFYREISRLCFSRGWLRLYTLATETQYLAHQFCFEYQNKMFLLQEGFDPEWTQHGIGNVLRAYVFRDCINRNLTGYDFLGGVTAHKLSWGAVVKQSVRAVAGRAIVKNTLFFQLPKAQRWGKERLKRILPQAILERGSFTR